MKQNHWVSKIEYIKTIFIPFMTATLDKKSVHLDSYLSENACSGYDFDVRHVAKFTVAGGQTSAEQRNRCTRVQPFRKPWRKMENLVMVNLNAATFLASIWYPGGISAGTGS